MVIYVYSWLFTFHSHLNFMVIYISKLFIFHRKLYFMVISILRLCIFHVFFYIPWLFTFIVIYLHSWLFIYIHGYIYISWLFVIIFLYSSSKKEPWGQTLHKGNSNSLKYQQEETFCQQIPMFLSKLDYENALKSWVDNTQAEIVQHRP